MYSVVSSSFIRFKALLVVVTSMLLLASCGGGGGGGGSQTNNNVSSGPPSKLFVADDSAVASSANITPLPGLATVDRLITGPSSNLFHVQDLLIDAANNRLYVANATSILVFNNPGVLTGDAAPARRITSNQFGNVSSLSLDSVHDVLYVGDNLNGIWVFNNASTIDGLRTPDRSITGNFGAPSFDIRGIYVDTARDLLYVSRTQLVTPATDDVVVFANASTLNGSSNIPVRTISPNPSINAGHMFLDVPSDRLYLADSRSYSVRIIDNASSASGSVIPTRTIYFGAAINDIAVDLANDRLYAVNSGVLYVLNSLSTVNGTAMATAVLAPGGSVLTAVAIAP